MSIFEAAGTALNSFVENIILGSVQAFATILSTFTVDKLGRRIPLFLSAVAMIVALTGLGKFKQF